EGHDYPFDYEKLEKEIDAIQKGRNWEDLSEAEKNQLRAIEEQALKASSYNYKPPRGNFFFNGLRLVDDGVRKRLVIEFVLSDKKQDIPGIQGRRLDGRLIREEIQPGLKGEDSHRFVLYDEHELPVSHESPADDNNKEADKNQA